MAFNGRELTVDWDAVTIAGVRQKTASLSKSMVDVTTDDADGWRTLLPAPGMRSIDITIDGVTENEVFIAEFFKADTAVTGEPVVVNLPSTLAVPGDYTGTFMLVSFEHSGAHDGEYAFSVQLQSSGPVTYTASAAS